MAGRFYICKDGDSEYFKEKSKAKNTRLSTNTWLNVYNTWVGYTRKIYEYPPEQLDGILENFYLEIHKKDGDKYEPAYLDVMHALLDRYLKDNGYQFSIVRDLKFAASKSTLGVARSLQEEGKGKRPNRTRSLSQAEEEVSYEVMMLR